MRDLALLPAEPQPVFEALRSALSGSGPAIMPIALASPNASPDASPATPPVGPVAATPRVPVRTALVVETSGSTGGPKRVALSTEALLASAAASDSTMGGAGQWLLALPVHYIAGLNVLVRSITSGTVPVMMGPGRFDPLAFADAAARLEASLRYTSLVPAQLGTLLDTPEALPALRRFDRILVGGQSTPAPLLERARAAGLNLTRTYGSSETAGGCVYDGIPIGNTAVRIVDGQVELSGSVLADGYLDADFEPDEARTMTAFVADGAERWYRTNDAGMLDAGRLSITGRLDDVIISGGLKVSLAAIETVVRAQAGQRDAVVVAVPSERWGEVPVLVTTVATDLASLRSIVVAALGRAAAPEAVRVVEELPMLSSGKPDRRAIAKLAAETSR